MNLTFSYDELEGLPDVVPGALDEGAVGQEQAVVGRHLKYRAVNSTVVASHLMHTF